MDSPSALISVVGVIAFTPIAVHFPSPCPRPSRIYIYDATSIHVSSQGSISEREREGSRQEVNRALIYARSKKRGETKTSKAPMRTQL